MRSVDRDDSAQTGYVPPETTPFVVEAEDEWYAFCEALDRPCVVRPELLELPDRSRRD